jgi:lysine 2,3-aminomutase
MATLRGRLSDICLLTYVMDIPGGFGKLPIGRTYLTPQSTAHLVEDPNSKRHTYKDLG